MAATKTVTIAILDPPYESEQSTTALRLVHEALHREHKSRCSPTKAPSA